MSKAKGGKLRSYWSDDLVDSAYRQIVAVCEDFKGLTTDSSAKDIRIFATNYCFYVCCPPEVLKQNEFALMAYYPRIILG